MIAVVLLLLVVVRRGVPSPTRTASPELRRVARLVAKLERRWRRASVSAVASTATTLALAEEARYQHPGQQSAPQTVGRYYSARFGGGPVPSDLQAELKSLIRATPRRFGPTRR